MKDKYLPIGSVVLLKGSKKRLMITGFCIKDKDKDIMYDYCGCLYPEGVIEPQKIALFNHEQIVKIYFIGLEDSSEIEFKKNLLNVMKQTEKNTD